MPANLPTPKVPQRKMPPWRKVALFKLKNVTFLSDEDFKTENEFRAKYGQAFEDLFATVPPKWVATTVTLDKRELFIKGSVPHLFTITNHKYLPGLFPVVKRRDKPAAVAAKGAKP
jgi:hypothetical protein